LDDMAGGFRSRWAVQKVGDGRSEKGAVR
jgi:hypothetical protein